jgi:hypothetical protein
MMSDYPKFIALCGYPNSGKSTVQDILNKQYGVIPVDDGAFLRKAAMDWFNLSYSDTHTQDGKAQYTDICGKAWQNRDILGTLGSILEATFGDQVVPTITLNGLEVQPGVIYSFGSVRKNQGLTYKAAGGVVVEIVRPGFEARYDFDEYDRDLVDITINNDNHPIWKTSLELAVKSFMNPIQKKIEAAHNERFRYDVI